MENNNRILISPRFSKDDYLDLHLTQNSSDEIWIQAVSIFDDRLYGRFWQPINILSSNINENGFAIMALECLLIETLLQFDLGVEVTPPGNWRNYSQFLKKHLSELFDKKSSERFYSDIRCGILHSAQTKRGSILTTKTDYVINFQDEILSVSVEGLTNALLDYYKDYKEKILCRNNVEARRKFIDKMNYICIR